MYSIQLWDIIYDIIYYFLVCVWTLLIDDIYGFNDIQSWIFNKVFFLLMRPVWVSLWSLTTRCHRFYYLAAQREIEGNNRLLISGRWYWLKVKANHFLPVASNCNLNESHTVQFASIVAVYICCFPHCCDKAKVQDYWMLTC